MSKDNSDFELFQKEFKRYQELFGLSGYHVYFEYKSLGTVIANIFVNQEDMTAIVRLNSRPSKQNKKNRDMIGGIKKCAKHEAIHLLIARLEKNGGSRFISLPDFYEASEELATKLENLIPDLL